MSLARDDERKRPDGAVMLRELHTKGWSWLRDASAQRSDSSDLRELVQHLASGVTGEPSIRAITGWPEQRYKNAARRYANLLRAMPSELRDAIEQTLARAPANAGDDWRKAKGTETGAGVDVDPDERFDVDAASAPAEDALELGDLLDAA